MGSRLTQRSRRERPKATSVPPTVRDVLRSSGQTLDPAARAFMEPRLGHEFGQVRVHTDAKAAESARAMHARAYTVGRDVVFGAGQYAPETSWGRRLLGHELTHVVQQASVEPRVQAFTADRDLGSVVLRPEKGDTDADLDRVLCPAVKDRKIAGREQIPVDDCLPQGTARALTMGPTNCMQFVRYALGGEPAPVGQADLSKFLVKTLWEELLAKGYRIPSIAVKDEQGKVQAVEPRRVSWKQLNPRMGDVVFMDGGIDLDTTGDPANPDADNFKADWGHVGLFLVRSREGFDYHFAKDGTDKPVGVFHTGMAQLSDEDPGAYVTGAYVLMAYLRPPAGQHGEVKVEEGRLLGELPPAR